MSGVSVLSALRACSDARIVGSDIHPRNWVAASTMVDDFVALPPGQAADDYADALLGVCLREQIGLVMPLTDPEVDVLAAHKARFANHGVTICTSDADAIALARDKLALHARFSGDPRVAAIPSFPLCQVADLPAFPLLVKPRRGAAARASASCTTPRILRPRTGTWTQTTTCCSPTARAQCSSPTWYASVSAVQGSVCAVRNYCVLPTVLVPPCALPSPRTWKHRPCMSPPRSICMAAQTSSSCALMTATC